MKNGLIKTKEEIEIIAEGGKLIHNILQSTAELVKPGVTTWDLNEFAEKEILKIGGKPSFKGFGERKNPFPAALCTSANDVVVHGIPSRNHILKNGDLISLDIGMEYKGLFTDTAITVPVGDISSEAQKLIKTSEQCLYNAIDQAKPGNRIGDIAYATQSTAEKAGFNVVRDLVGHGVGYAVHEDPAVPCFGQKGQGPLLKEGMVLAIEPMVVTGEYFLEFLPDGWTIRTQDRSLASHFEHTVAVLKDGARILT
jgi:methionyl aminopeptidase